MTKDQINEVRGEFKSLLAALVDMARQNGEPITEIMMVQRDGPETIDQLCDLAIRGLAAEQPACTAALDSEGEKK